MSAAYGVAIQLCGVLEAAGHQARLAGGCVRDRLLGVTPNDYDVATTALPEVALGLLKEAGYRVIPTGLAHGTISAVKNQQVVEVTTLRTDRECDGRHAQVSFATGFELDAKRRDFTINAMYEDQHGQIFDFVGGQKDLQEQKLRFVGHAEDRISEDYLRALRYFRFLTRLGWPAQPEALSAIKKHSQGLRHLSVERIQAEWNRMLVQPHLPGALPQMQACGILEVLFPWICPDRIAALGDALVAMRPLRTGGKMPIFQWFSTLYFGRAIPPKTTDMQQELKRWRFPRTHSRQLVQLTRLASATNSRKRLSAAVDLLESHAGLADSDLLKPLEIWQHHFSFSIQACVLQLIRNWDPSGRPPPPRQALLALPPPERSPALRVYKIAYDLGLWRTNPEQTLRTWHSLDAQLADLE